MKNLSLKKTSFSVAKRSLRPKRPNKFKGRALCELRLLYGRGVILSTNFSLNIAMPSGALLYL